MCAPSARISCLYEMATGERSFLGGTTAVIYDAILNRDPQAPRELNANVPEELERIIGKALEKNRSTRYQTAAELRADLEALKRERDLRSSGSRPELEFLRQSKCVWLPSWFSRSQLEMVALGEYTWMLSMSSSSGRGFCFKPWLSRTRSLSVSDPVGPISLTSRPCI